MSVGERVWRVFGEICVGIGIRLYRVWWVIVKIDFIFSEIRNNVGI